MIGCLNCGKKTRKQEINPKHDDTPREHLNLFKAFCCNDCSCRYYDHVQFINTSWSVPKGNGVGYFTKTKFFEARV